MAGKERRAFVRLKAHHLLKCKEITPIGGDRLTISGMDISGGGVMFIANGPLETSKIVELQIHFPHLPQPIPTLAKVVWTKRLGRSNRYKVGTQFIEIDKFYRDAVVKQINFVNKKVSGLKKEKKGSLNEPR